MNRWQINSIVPGHGDLGGKEIAEALKQYFLDMKIAASDPSKEKELIAKYAGWTKMRGMMSQENTIRYIKSGN